MIMGMISNDDVHNCNVTKISVVVEIDEKNINT